jgi:hypothetical protein
VETFHDSCDSADLRGTFQGTSQHGDAQGRLQGPFHYVVVSLSFELSSESINTNQHFDVSGMVLEILMYSVSRDASFRVFDGWKEKRVSTSSSLRGRQRVNQRVPQNFADTNKHDQVN